MEVMRRRWSTGQREPLKNKELYVFKNLWEINVSDELDTEAKAMENLLTGKSIDSILRPRENEVCIQCSDGTRLIIDISQNNKLNFSVTGA